MIIGKVGTEPILNLLITKTPLNKCFMSVKIKTTSFVVIVLWTDLWVMVSPLSYQTSLNRKMFHLIFPSFTYSCVRRESKRNVCML